MSRPTFLAHRGPSDEVLDDLATAFQPYSQGARSVATTRARWPRTSTGSSASSSAGRARTPPTARAPGPAVALDDHPFVDAEVTHGPDFHALTLPFEGEPLTTLTWDGKPAWVAREIGRRLGYAGNGKRLVTRIGREWAAEFIEGKDYVLLSGDELAAFKAAVGLGTPEVPSRAGGLLLLLEPGLHLVLTKTNKPIGVRLRRFLVDEVLPQLVRTGAYAPSGPHGRRRGDGGRRRVRRAAARAADRARRAPRGAPRPPGQHPREVGRLLPAQAPGRHAPPHRRRPRRRRRGRPRRGRLAGGHRRRDRARP
jgi:prophage antirepressor-like protein